MMMLGHVVTVKPRPVRLRQKLQPVRVLPVQRHIGQPLNVIENPEPHSRPPVATLACVEYTHGVNPQGISGITGGIHTIQAASFLPERGVT
jgi:hypothetical protein